MTIHATISLSSETATRLTPNGLHSGMDITIQNVDGAAYVYIGGEGVTTTSYGFRIAPGAGWAIELPGRDALYAITDTENSQIAVLKTSLENGN
jgi:hypothetical protein